MNDRPVTGRQVCASARGGKIARRLLVVMGILSVAVLLVVAVRLVWIYDVQPGLERGVDRRLKLEQILRAFEMYAFPDRKGRDFPPMASGDAAFQIDLDALGPYFDSDQQALQDYLAGKTGTDVCYLGHVVAGDLAAQLLLDEYVDRGIDQVRDSNIELDHAIFHGRTSHPTRTLWRLSGSRDGWLEIFEQGISEPVSLYDETMELIPVLWELPNEAEPRPQQGGWLLDRSFDSGLSREGEVSEVKWRPYPALFPMTEEFVRRIREMRSMPPAEWKKAQARTMEEFPEAGRIREAIRPLQEARFVFGSPVFLSWAVAHLDRRPSVELESHKGYRVVLRNQSLSRSVTPRFRLDPQAVIELVVFPSDEDLPAGTEQRIAWQSQREDDQACAVDLGQGAGYRWFGRAAPPWLGFVQERLALSGGNGYLDELAAWMTRNKDYEMTPLALGALSRQGAAAVSFLEREFEHPTILLDDERNRRGYLMSALAKISDAHAGELLANLYTSGDEPVRSDAGSDLVHWPRPEGKTVYLDMLRRKEYTDEGSYVGSFAALARAAAQFGGPEARPLLQELCVHPNEHVASQARLVLEGWPIPEGLIGILGESDEAGIAREATVPNNAPTFIQYRRGNLKEGTCFDLDTGRVFEVPLSVAVADEPAVTRDWLRNNGIDVVFGSVLAPDLQGLVFLDSRTLSSEEHAWDRSASEIGASLQRAQRVPSDLYVPLPVVRLFQTREGAAGVFRCSVDTTRNPLSKNPPETVIRLSYKLVEGVSTALRQLDMPPATPDTALDARGETPTSPTDHYLIGVARQAIMRYAQAHEKQWPDSLEDLLAGGYLTVPDPDAFLSEFEYVKPWISLEELEGVSPWWGWQPAYKDFQTVLVVRRTRDKADD